MNSTVNINPDNVLQSVESFTNEFVGFVKVTMADGATGWGQVSTYHSDITCQVLHRQVAPWLIGKDMTDLDDQLDRVAEHEHKFPGSYLRRAMAGLDTAIWDMRGKREGKSVCELLGAQPGPLRVYASSMKRDIKPDDEAERILRLIDKCGYDAFKFRVGAECGRNHDEWPGRTEAIVPTIRKAVGDSFDLLVDANSCYEPARAIEVGKLLEDHSIGHFEEPCPYWEPEKTREVKEALSVDVSGGEQDCDLGWWKLLLEMGTVDIAQPDVCYVGGISRALRVASMAAEQNIPVTPHCANLSLVTLFTAHLLKALPNAGKYLEFSIEEADYYPWQYGLYRNDPYVITDGKITISGEPGWGVEIDQQWLHNASYQKSDQALPAG